jgi:Domain of unknown function (DUF6265)
MKLFVSLLSLVCCSVSAQCELSSLDSLVGQWQAQTKKSVVSESWHKVSEQSFEGLGQSHDMSGVLKDSEELRLVQMQGNVFYLAKVKHNPLPVAFALISCQNNKFRFENKNHDFPKQLDYQLLSADSLQVDVSDGAGQGFRLNFNRQKG